MGKYIESYFVEGTDTSPYVILDPENNKFEIAGRSMPEDVNEFYGPIEKWIVEYGNNPLPKTIINLKMEYYNTASASMLMWSIMKPLEMLYKKGVDITIRWHFADGDENLEEAGQEYAEFVKLPFEFVAY